MVVGLEDMIPISQPAAGQDQAQIPVPRRYISLAVSRDHLKLVELGIDRHTWDGIIAENEHLQSTCYLIIYMR